MGLSTPTEPLIERDTTLLPPAQMPEGQRIACSMLQAVLDLCRMEGIALEAGGGTVTIWAPSPHNRARYRRVKVCQLPGIQPATTQPVRRRKKTAGADPAPAPTTADDKDTQ